MKNPWIVGFLFFCDPIATSLSLTLRNGAVSYLVGVHIEPGHTLDSRRVSFGLVAHTAKRVHHPRNVTFLHVLHTIMQPAFCYLATKFSCYLFISLDKTKVKCCY